MQIMNRNVNSFKRQEWGERTKNWINFQCIAFVQEFWKAFMSFFHLSIAFYTTRDKRKWKMPSKGRKKAEKQRKPSECALRWAWEIFLCVSTCKSLQHNLWKTFLCRCSTIQAHSLEPDNELVTLVFLLLRSLHHVLWSLFYCFRSGWENLFKAKLNSNPISWRAFFNCSESRVFWKLGLETQIQTNTKTVGAVISHTCRQVQH